MKNWKTTLTGVASAMLYAATGTHDWKHVLVAVSLAAFATLAKDA